MLEIIYYFLYGELKHNIFSPIKSWIIGVPYYHLWYLYMNVELYLSVPYLLKLKKKVGEEKFLKLGIMFFILGLFIFIFEEFLNYINFYERYDMFKYLKYFWDFNQFKFINYLGYSLQNLKNQNINFKNMIFLTITFLTIIFVIVEVLVRKNLMKNPLFFYSNNFIFAMDGAVLLYLAFNESMKLFL